MTWRMSIPEYSYHELHPALATVASQVELYDTSSISIHGYLSDRGKTEVVTV